jgi:hypothetical protein
VAYRRWGRSDEGRGCLQEVLAVTARYGSTTVVAGISRSTCAGGWTRRRRVLQPNHGDIGQPKGTGSFTGNQVIDSCKNWRTTHRGARSTFTGSRVKSGDRGLASPARQSLIPCSGSFTEACTVYSEGRTRLVEALLVGLRWRLFGWPRARHARGNASDLVLWWGRVRVGEYGRSPWWLYKRGRGQRRWLGLARRGARGGGRRACSGELRARRTRGFLLLFLFYHLLSGQNMWILP